MSEDDDDDGERHVPNWFEDGSYGRRILETVDGGLRKPGAYPHESFCKLNGPFLPLRAAPTETDGALFSHAFSSWRDSVNAVAGMYGLNARSQIDAAVAETLKGESHRFSPAGKLPFRVLKSKLRSSPCGRGGGRNMVAFQPRGSEALLFGNAFGSCSLLHVEEDEVGGRWRLKGQGEQRFRDVSSLSGIKVSRENGCDGRDLALFQSKRRVVLRSLDSPSTAVIDLDADVIESEAIPTRRRIIVATRTSEAKLFDVATRKLVEKVELEEDLDRWLSLRVKPSNLQNSVLAATRKAVRLFDLRTNAASSLMFKFSGREALGGVCNYLTDSPVAFGASNHRAFFLDERMPQRIGEVSSFADVAAFGSPVAIPVGCSTRTSRHLRYVATFWSDFTVAISCCDSSSGLPRGSPLLVDGPQPRGADEEAVVRRLGIPLNGLDLVEGSSSLALFAVNAVGDLFVASLGHESPDDHRSHDRISWPEPSGDGGKEARCGAERFAASLPPSARHFKLANMVVRLGEGARDVKGLTRDRPAAVPEPRDEAQSAGSLGSFEEVDAAAYCDGSDENVTKILRGENAFSQPVDEAKQPGFAKVKRRSYLEPGGQAAASGGMPVRFRGKTSYYCPIQVEGRSDGDDEPLHTVPTSQPSEPARSPKPKSSDNEDDRFGEEDMMDFEDFELMY